MSRTGLRIKRRVWVGTGAAIVGVATWAWWEWGGQVKSVEQENNPRPFVQLGGADAEGGNRIFQEKAELLDPTPLFFPTNWNYGQRPLDESRLRHPGQAFENFQPRPLVAEENLKLYGGEASLVPEKLSDLLIQGNEAPFAGMGQIDIQKSTLPVRAGYLEVRRLGAKENVIMYSLTGIQLSRTDFAPVEFLVVIGSAGLIGEPILLNSSGWDEVDSFFRTYFAKSYHLSERLSPGRYLVVVGV